MVPQMVSRLREIAAGRRSRSRSRRIRDGGAIAIATTQEQRRLGITGRDGDGGGGADGRGGGGRGGRDAVEVEAEAERRVHDDGSNSGSALEDYAKEGEGTEEEDEGELLRDVCERTARFWNLGERYDLAVCAAGHALGYRRRCFRGLRPDRGRHSRRCSDAVTPNLLLAEAYLGLNDVGSSESCLSVARWIVMKTGESEPSTRSASIKLLGGRILLRKGRFGEAMDSMAEAVYDFSVVDSGGGTVGNEGLRGLLRDGTGLRGDDDDGG